MSTLIGYSRFTGKNGRNYCVANVTSEFSARDIQNGAAGLKSQEVFLPDDQLDYLTPADCGKKCQLDYEINGGRAYLINFSVEGHK